MPLRVAILLLLPVIAGCGSPRILVPTDGDEARARVMELEQENRELQREVTELRAQLDASAATPRIPPAEIVEAWPRPVDLTIGRLSGVVDTSGDDLPDTVRLYLQPADGRGRFVQLFGRLSVHAAVLPDGGTARSVGRLDLDPHQLRDAWRSGFTGTHYTVELPLDPSAALAEPLLTVQVTYTDALTGETLSAQRGLDMVNGP